MKIQLDIAQFPTDALRQLAYTLLHAGPEMRRPEDQMRTWKQAKLCIEYLDARDSETSELREMLDHWNANLQARASGRGLARIRRGF